MKIACLAWGSLLWKTAPLRLATPWQPDGPRLPLEFCRVGDGGELSTALCEGAPLQQSWWALFEDMPLAEAREQLRRREEIDAGRPDWIGSAPANADGPGRSSIEAWRIDKGLDAVVWTALPPRHADTEGRAPDADQAVHYLAGLQGEIRDHAESYVRRVPARFDSANRRAIAQRLGWSAATP